jgi:hypothetical protein
MESLVVLLAINTDPSGSQSLDVAMAETGNEPAAKLAHAKTDALLLRSSTARRKIIVFDDDEHPKKGSLARLFARRGSSWLHDVEVWRHWDGTFERVPTS